MLHIEIRSHSGCLGITVAVGSQVNAKRYWGGAMVDEGPVHSQTVTLGLANPLRPIGNNVLHTQVIPSMIDQVDWSPDRRSLLSPCHKSYLKLF